MVVRGETALKILETLIIFLFGHPLLAREEAALVERGPHLAAV
jgi:hypothetical protein